MSRLDRVDTVAIAVTAAVVGGEEGLARQMLSSLGELGIHEVELTFIGAARICRELRQDASNVTVTVCQHCGAAISKAKNNIWYANASASRAWGRMTCPARADGRSVHQP